MLKQRALQLEGFFVPQTIHQYRYTSLSRIIT